MQCNAKAVFATSAGTPYPHTCWLDLKGEGEDAKVVRYVGGIGTTKEEALQDAMHSAQRNGHEIKS